MKTPKLQILLCLGSCRLGPLFKYLMKATLCTVVTSYRYTQGTPLRYCLLVKSKIAMTRLLLGLIVLCEYWLTAYQEIASICRTILCATFIAHWLARVSVVFLDKTLLLTVSPFPPGTWGVQVGITDLFGQLGLRVRSSLFRTSMLSGGTGMQYFTLQKKYKWSSL